MGQKKTPGLYKRYGLWQIDKKVNGHRICESTGTNNLREAEKYLAKQIEELRTISVYGIRPERTFRQAATKYLLDNQRKASIDDDAYHLKLLDKYIGNLYLSQLDLSQLDETALSKFIKDRYYKHLVQKKTINLALEVVRRILNLAAYEWKDEARVTWLETAPKIKMLKVDDARDPYPLSWEEQDRLFATLPEHLQNMALFKVNTGCREQEVCQLRWEWEIPIPSLGTSIFIIPDEIVKNGENRLVVLNKIAMSVIDKLRGQHDTSVFTYRGHPVTKMNNTAWKKARIRVGLEPVRVHDLKHTFGQRLRAAGVSFEDRQDLLGHKSTRVTTHYSAAELTNLMEAANRVCHKKQVGPIINLYKWRKNRPTGSESRESPVRGNLELVG